MLDSLKEEIVEETKEQQPPTSDEVLNEPEVILG